MRSPARLRIAASFLAISVAAACGSDSTGPGQPTAAQLAAHFDSIAIQANAQSETNSAYGIRSFLTTLIELPAALGAVPSTVSVTTANGVEQWKAYELLEVLPPSGSNTDSSFVLLAFRDGDAHTAVAVFFDSTGTAEDGGIITGDTIAVNPSQGSGTTSLTSTSTTCATPAASLLNPNLGTLTIGQCNLAKFRTTLSLISPTTPGMDAALTTVTFTNATINGIRATDQASGASLRRLKTMLRAADNTTRF
jgi:hypothetical protein